MDYAFTLYQGKKQHFETSFLNKIPSKLNPFDADSLDDRMVTKPNEREYVFVRFHKDYEVYSLNVEVDVTIKREQVYFLPYKAVREFCEKGEASLL